MGLTFLCPGCGGSHHDYTRHYENGNCYECAQPVKALPAPMPDAVKRALSHLWARKAVYRILRGGGSPAVQGIALKSKTRGLIQHDRILRGEA